MKMAEIRVDIAAALLPSSEVREAKCTPRANSQTCQELF